MRPVSLLVILTVTFFTDYTTLIAGHALRFDRNDHFEVFIPSSRSLDISDATITIECWINFPDPGNAPISIIAAKGGAAQSGSWKTRVNVEGVFQVRFMINGQGSGWFGTGFVEANTWTHVAATYDGQAIRTYVDGDLQSTSDYQGNIDASNEPLRFGRRDAQEANFFEGLIDEFRIWDSARSGEEINRTMNVLIPNNAEALVGYWRLDEGEGQIVNDQTENENDGWLGQNENDDARDPEWVESDAPLYGGVLHYEANRIEFGPVIADNENVMSIMFSNQSEEDDDWNAIEFIFHDDGNPDWLDIDPEEGIIDVDEDLEVNFIADLEGIEPGEYERLVLLECNASNLQTLEIPVHILVVEGAGRLSGRITDAETGDPIADALISAIADFELSRVSDEDGQFEFAELPAYEYRFNITAEDFLPLETELFEIGAGDEIEMVIEMSHAELNLNPDRIEIAIEQNDIFVTPLNIRNGGNGPLSWTAERIFPEEMQFEPWDARWEFAAGEELDNTRIGGVELAGNFVFIAAGVQDGDNLVYVLNHEGEQVDEFTQAGESHNGYRDLAWDGELLWGTDDGQVYGFTTEGEVVVQFDSPRNIIRAITYDSELELLWMCDVVTDIWAYDREGNEVAVIDRPDGMRIYGLAHFPEDPDGFTLWVYANNVDFPSQIFRINPEDGQIEYVYEPQMEGSASGVTISSLWDPFSWVLIALTNSPDNIGVFQLGSRNEWLNIAPTAGVLDAGEDIDLEVTLSTGGLPADEDFSADLLFKHNGVGGESVVPMVLSVTGEGGVTQRRIRLNLGWNLISTNILPSVEQFVDVVLPLVESGALLLAKDEEGRFYSPDQLNQLEEWDVFEAYWLKLNQPADLLIEGETIAWDTPIQLTDGWNLLSYLPRGVTEAPVALRDLGESLIIIRDGRGRFYIPEYDFSNIGGMRESMGYSALVEGDVEFSYGIGENVAEENHEHSHADISWLNDNPALGSSSVSSFSLLLQTDGQLPLGTRLQAYTTDGTPAGRGLVDAAGRAGLALLADDVSTEDIEGFVAGESISAKIANSDDDMFKLNLIDGSGVWTESGWGVVRVEAVVTPNDFGILSIHPNPFNSLTKIRFGLPTSSQVIVEVYDVTGRLVSTLADRSYIKGEHTLSWDASLAAASIYILSIKSNEQIKLSKLVLIK